MAVRWLGGQASGALTADPAWLDMPRERDSRAAPAFLVRRRPDPHPTLARRERNKTGRDTVGERLAGSNHDP
jgi:hypothetical protein